MNSPIPCHGRPVELGCLYDASTENFLSGTRLWSQDTTEAMTKTKCIPNRRISTNSDPTFSNKANHLNISPGLLLNIQCGLFPLEGSSRYLLDSKVSGTSKTITLMYSIQTIMKELHLGPEVDNPKYLTDGTATHIVTGIKYGGRAYLVFEMEKEKENLQHYNVNGKKMARRQKKMAGRQKEESFLLDRKSVQQSCDVSVALATKAEFRDASDKIQKYLSRFENYNTIRFSCYSDFHVDPKPMLTVKDVFSYIQSFDSQNANSPLEVYLTPLSHIGGLTVDSFPTASNVHLISAGDYRQLLHEVIGASRSMADKLAESPWQPLRESLLLFAKLVESHMTSFCEEILKLRLGTRGTNDHDNRIQALLSNYRDNSPFSPKQLQLWKASKERECGILQACTDTLVSAGTKTLRDAAEMDLFGFSTKKRFLIEVQLPADSRFLGILKEFLDTKKYSGTMAADTESWIGTEPFNLFSQLAFAATRFLKRNSSISSAIVGLLCEGNQTIRLITKMLDNHRWSTVNLPAPPKNLKCVEIAKEGVDFTWEYPDGISSEACKFKLEVVGSWTTRTILTDQKCATVQGLKSDTRYKVEVSSVTDIGQSEPLEISVSTSDVCCKC